jgi:hypothetical protein
MKHVTGGHQVFLLSPCVINNNGMVTMGPVVWDQPNFVKGPVYGGRPFKVISFLEYHFS